MTKVMKADIPKPRRRCCRSDSKPDKVVSTVRESFRIRKNQPFFVLNGSQFVFQENLSQCWTQVDVAGRCLRLWLNEDVAPLVSEKLSPPPVDCSFDMDLI